jgi:hypothetical protein
MKTTRLILALGLFSLAASVSFAQVPQLINYQGRVAVGSTNFTGNGQFKFALVGPGGTPTFWSNNGTSVGGSEPSAAVSLTVANGLYAVLLGDATLPNMTVIPATVFTNADVRLRVWFSDGVTGSQLFTPDQRIAAVGYAMMSANVPDGLITANKLANGAVTAAKIADGAVTGSKLALNTITSSNMADTIALGASNVTGRLDVYRTTEGTPSISLLGGSSRISTYGSDGLEQTRLWGSGYGELILNNSLSNNATAVTLTAQGSTGGRLTLNNTNGSSRAILEGENTGGLLTLYTADGNTGAILYGNEGQGSGALSLRNTNGSSRFRAYGGPLNGSMQLYNDAGFLSMYLYNYNGDEGTVSVRNGAGGETVYLWGRDSFGSGDGQIGLKKASGTETVTIQAGEGSTAGGQMIMRNLAGQQTIQLDADASGVHCGYLALYTSNGVATIILDANGSGDGKITTQVLQITGGSDLSEQFDIKAIHDELKAGMIVSIDPDQPGQLMTSTKAYDKTVAGIVSGAGGVQTGMLMGQRGTAADGKHAVALTGRVYCWVDADQGGAIEPGDMITTSATPGHGMKVTDHSKAGGAVIGKAMGRLSSGKGLVLVLVSLQ